MKLLTYTSFYFSLVLVLALSVWAVLFYNEILDEIYDSMDDGLDNQRLLVIKKSKIDPAVLQHDSLEDGYYIIRQISQRQHKNMSDSYRDTLIYMLNEEDYEPVRLLETSFKRNDSYYKLVVFTSMVEEDDLTEDLLYSILWLYVGLVVILIVLNNLILKRIWRPFYQLISNLRYFQLEKNTPVDFAKTRIEEFTLLNTQIESLLSKAIDSYNSQKRFIENASHELQTPLAISINKIELFTENNELTDEQLQTMATVLEHLERLTRLNKSLLLLSKIENTEYDTFQDDMTNSILLQVTTDLSDLAEHHKISIDVEQESEITFRMNKDLARILFVNLIKNAIIHGKPGTTVTVQIRQNSVAVSNHSENSTLDTQKIFTRFYYAGNSGKSTGLGLAIAKAIADKYALNLSYLFEDDHHIFIVSSG